MASVKTNQSINGLQNDFEATATHMLPYDLVQKKRVDHGTKRGPADISDATGEVERMSTFHPSEPRKAMDPVEFPFDTTRKKNMICLTRDRWLSFVNGEGAS